MKVIVDTESQRRVNYFVKIPSSQEELEEFIKKEMLSGQSVIYARVCHVDEFMGDTFVCRDPLDRLKKLHEMFCAAYLKWRPWQFRILNLCDNSCEFAWVETEVMMEKYRET